MTFRPELLDELLKSYQNPEDLLGEGGILKQLTSSSEGCNAKKWDQAGSVKGTKKVGCLDKMFGINPNCQDLLPMNCNNTISATLDLTQSLKSFEKTIAGEMSLSDVSQWDV